MNITELTHPQLIELCKKLKAENLELRSKITDHGVASELLRAPENFHQIDDVLEKYQRPFTLTEVFTDWVKLVKLAGERQKTLSTLRQHFSLMLKNNGIIYRSGGTGRSALWRVRQEYDFILRKSGELNWRKLGQDEGTYLVPSTQ